ncbi:hypothetical protein [Streptomyces boninensis]|uniref:hypothetical protein n=1 Tax=Streptomyces boninensis TaxID=2039455 RepID=UPI003B2254F6
MTDTGTVPVTRPQPAATPPAGPRRSGPPISPPPGPRVLATGALTCGAAVAVGALAGGRLRELADLYAGVGALLALTGSVTLGLATTFRRLLPATLRTWLQHAHRAAGLAGLVFLVVHIAVKSAAGRVAPGDVFGYGDELVALGALAALLFVAATAVGLWRGIFAARRWIRPFRLLHGLSYLAWIASLVHGLTAGRAPAWWVVAGYACVGAAAAVALAVRLRRS